ncbi:MAG: helix-hairpin-helix domain-containing protein [Candidatus Kariarchaeaceae archaeon]
MQKKITSHSPSDHSIIDLIGVSSSIEKTLYEAGYDTLEKIAIAKINDLDKLQGIGKVTAKKIIKSAQEASLSHN